ncbi:hypothetical protein [Elizabethkingia phage TCUEAP1]|nr:hypothetical protein [Elizabethkingia phage TCUEAP1]
MRTYITTDKRATQAKSKFEAALILNVSMNKVYLSGLHIDYLKGYERIIK